MAARIRCNLGYCTCRQQLGKYQSEFEIRISQGEKPIDVLDSLGMNKMCCRTNMLYPPTFPVIDSNAGRVIDEGGILGIEQKFTYLDGPDIYLDNVPPFPVFNK